MFDSLKKKFSGTIGKISDQFSSEEEEEAAKAKEKEEKSASKIKDNNFEPSSGKKENKKIKKPSEKETSKNFKSTSKIVSSEKVKTTSKKDTKDKIDTEYDISLKEDEEDKKSRFSFLRRKPESKSDDSEKEKSKVKPEDSAIKGEDDSKIAKTDAEISEGEMEEPSGLFTFATHKTISENDIEDILFELELALLEGDVALEVAEQIVNSVKEDLVGRKIKRRGDVAEFTMEALKKAISDILVADGPNLKELVKNAKKTGEPLKIMFVGVNGTGKTTTISKIADHYVKEGYTPVIAASDTFRAGAIEQISYHAEKVGVKIIRHQKGADPAAVAYDAVEHARAQKKELVLIDTAGRMQTNVNLMDEMKKIQRVVKPDLAIFVGDALTGNDAVEQARKFDDAVGVDGIILTKADADAKGGAALSIGHVINKPILFLGVGQGYGDIIEFHPDWMVEQVLGD